MREQEIKNHRIVAATWYKHAGIVLSEKEQASIEIADFGLGKFADVGLQIVTYINTKRYCAKEMLLLPKQRCPEHKHPRRNNGENGKQETFRCRWGEVYIYIPGEKTMFPKASPPKEDEQYYTSYHEVILKPGEQYTIDPNTAHWFAAGTQGCIVSEFSSNSEDATDIFTDPRIQRIPTSE